MRWQDFITMWAHPRLAAWVILTALVCALVRVVFAGLQILPLAAGLDPGFVLVPAAGIFLGPAGVLGVLAGSLLGDLITGVWGPLTLYRGIAHLLGALTARVLWQGSASDADAFDRQSWLQGAGRFVCAGLPAAFVIASWQGLGADAGRLYPFAYVASLVLFNNLFFLLLFAPAVYDAYVRHWFPVFGTWRSVMRTDAHGTRSAAGRLLIWLGSVGTYVAGVLVGGWCCGDWPGTPAVLGDWTGWPARTVVGMGLVVHMVGLLWALTPRSALRAEPEREDRPNLRFLRPL